MNMKTSNSLAILVFLCFGVVGTAQSAFVPYQTVVDEDPAMNISNLGGSSIVDHYGAGFNTKSIEFAYGTGDDANQYQITLDTSIGLDGVNDVINPFDAEIADFFIKTASGSITAISLVNHDDVNDDGVKEVHQSPGGIDSTVAKGYYSLNSSSGWYTSQDVWKSGNYYYGAYTKKENPFYDDPNTGFLAPTLIQSGNKFDDVAVSVSAITSSLIVNLAFDGAAQSLLGDLKDGFEFFWGTASCSNDAIFGHVSAVPLPGAVVLFGTALLGFLGYSGWQKKCGELS